jgi:hypothetical protein
MSIPEEHIQKVMDLLVAWSPLGNRADSIKQLDNYRTEAIDILFHLSLSDPKTNPAKIVRDILNEAFDLSLSLEECKRVGQEIAVINNRKRYINAKNMELRCKETVAEGARINVKPADGKKVFVKSIDVEP